jgi:hypothetical protein
MSQRGDARIFLLTSPWLLHQPGVKNFAFPAESIRRFLKGPPIASNCFLDETEP